jgi:ribosomal protein L11 methylase PrmA
MNFEIVIEGKARAISRLHEKLKAFLPATEDRPVHFELKGEKGRLVLLETRNSLPYRLSKVSRIIDRLKKDRLLQASFHLRTRNLAYSEASIETQPSKGPLKPIPSITIQPWHPSTARITDRKTIIIDSHSAFGTGAHPSSRLCLKYLEQMAQGRSQKRRLEGQEVLDFGCGTGLLAIAAVKMGASSALGIEISHDAARTAQKNVALNGLSEKIVIRPGSWEVVHKKYDLILANLVTAALIRTGKNIPDHLNDHGKVVISGFTQKQLVDMEKRFHQCGLTTQDRASLDVWGSLLMAIKDPQRS